MGWLTSCPESAVLPPTERHGGPAAFHTRHVMPIDYNNGEQVLPVKVGQVIEFIFLTGRVAGGAIRQVTP